MMLMLLNVLAFVDAAGSKKSIMQLIRPNFENLTRSKIPREAHREEVFDRWQGYKGHPLPGSCSRPCDKRQAHSGHCADHAGAVKGHNDTVRGSVMPCALWIVSAHASFSGTPIRMSDRFLVDCCWMQDTGTQLAGKLGSSGAPW
jgi:hypothetical protein